MILTLNEPFEGYVPVEKISDDKCAGREVYKAIDQQGQAVELVVYSCGDKQDAARQEAELGIYRTVASEAIPRLLQDGECDGSTIRWMALEVKDGAVRLDRWVDAHGPLEPSAAGLVAKALLDGLGRVYDATRGGGIYNICPENILLLTDGSDEAATITGASFTNLFCAGGPCAGSAPFNMDMLNILYTAPESKFGKFSFASDLYVMGLVLAYMVEGRYPWDVEGVSTLMQLERRRLQPRSAYSVKLFQMVYAHTLVGNVRLRYRKAEDMVTALRVALGEIEEDKDAAKTEKLKKQVQDSGPQGRGDDKEAEDEDDRQPKCNVVFAEVKGKGFDEVAGMAEIKRLLKRNFVDIVQHKDIAREFAILPPALTLMAGPSGCGKTFLAKKLAEECGLLFSYITPAQLGNTFVHGSQRMIADLFAKAEKKAKESKYGVLIMLDEFDAIAPARRGDDHSCHNDEVNELLTQLNECSTRGIYVLAATNRPDMLDGAVTRSGRMDEFIYIGLPDPQAREEMLALELSKRPHDEGLDMKRLTEITDGFTSSDICAIVKEAGREAFDRSIHSEDRSIVKISQQLLEDTINRARPSVSQEELREYERARDVFMHRDQRKRPRIGFSA